jgi:hypothetical protein
MGGGVASEVEDLNLLRCYVMSGGNRLQRSRDTAVSQSSGQSCLGPLDPEISGDLDLQQHRFENLKSHITGTFIICFLYIYYHTGFHSLTIQVRE